MKIKFYVLLLVGSFYSNSIFPAEQNCKSIDLRNNNISVCLNRQVYKVLNVGKILNSSQTIFTFLSKSVSTNNELSFLITEKMAFKGCMHYLCLAFSNKQPIDPNLFNICDIYDFIKAFTK